MWTRIVARQLCQNGNGFVRLSRRTVKSYVRTPRRILTDKQATELEPSESKVKEVRYTASDLETDQASRTALRHSRKKSAIGQPVSPESDLGEYVDGETIEKKRVVRLDKLDKTKNINFVQLLTKIRTKAYREKTRQILLEGKRLISDGLLAGCKLHTLIYCDPKVLEHLPIVEGEGERILIDKARMATWSLMEAPPGIMAIVERPSDEDVEFQEFRNDRIPFTVLVDGIREPTNMGIVIRTVAAAGCERVLLTKGTCDPWEEKVLRSGMGAHFRVPIFTRIDWAKLVNYVPEKFRVFLADSNSFEVVKEAASYFDDMKGDALRLTDGEDDEADRFGTGVQAVDKVRHDDGTVLQIEKQLHHRSKSKEAAINQHLLPIFKYHEPSYFGPEGDESHCLLVVGGETSSLSASAYQFAHLHSGCKVHIPMCNGVNSLSVGSALGVVAFEIQRQWRERDPLRMRAIQGDPELEQVEAMGERMISDGKEAIG